MLGRQMRPTTYSVGDLLEFKKSGNLHLSPNFQRNPVWTKIAKSYLIDSIVRGYPVPALLVREKGSEDDVMKTVREVVDGQQRIRTVLSFIKSDILNDHKESDNFTVSKIHNKEMAGKRFVELPDEIKRKILDYVFNVNVLPSNTSDKEILEIFSRINSTGVSLNAQELRNAKYQGSFKTVIFQLATEHYNNWLDWGVLTENDIARMHDSELVSEMAEFVLDPQVRDKKQKTLNKIYEDNDDLFKSAPNVSQKIREVLLLIHKAYGNDLKKSVFRTKGFFFILFVFLATLLKENSVNTVKLNKFLKKVDRLVKDGQLDNIFQSRRNTTLEVRKKILEYLMNHFTNESFYK